LLRDGQGAEGGGERQGQDDAVLHGNLLSVGSAGLACASPKGAYLTMRR
jgi:hypothetical protein